MPPHRRHWEDSRAFLVAVRVATLAGTAIAGFAVWIFLQAWGDIRDVRDGFGLLMTRVAVHDEKLGSLSADHIVLRKRLDVVQTRVFEVSRP